MKDPQITIVMPVYNAAAYLKEAVDSLLCQTYADFTLLIINDGSSDQSEAIILAYKDQRIQYVKNETNIGLVKTLNKGIELTNTTYFARMDADDISLPQRLSEQVAFLELHAEIGVCGTFFEKFGEEKGVPFLYETNDDIVANLLFTNGICHPSVMIRTALLKKNNIRFGVDFDYQDGVGHKLLEFEDYALWHKLKFVTRFANLNKVLLKYRREGQNLSVKNMDAINYRRKLFIANFLKELGIQPKERALMLHCNYNLMSSATVKADLQLLHAHFQEILSANEQKKIYPVQALQRCIDNQWKRLFYVISDKGIRFSILYWMVSGKFERKELLYALKTMNRNIFKTSV